MELLMGDSQGARESSRCRLESPWLQGPGRTRPSLLRHFQRVRSEDEGRISHDDPEIGYDCRRGQKSSRHMSALTPLALRLQKQNTHWLNQHIARAAIEADAAQPMPGRRHGVVVKPTMYESLASGSKILASSWIFRLRRRQTAARRRPTKDVRKTQDYVQRGVTMIAVVAKWGLSGTGTIWSCTTRHHHGRPERTGAAR